MYLLFAVIVGVIGGALCGAAVQRGDPLRSVVVGAFTGILVTALLYGIATGVVK